MEITKQDILSEEEELQKLVRAFTCTESSDMVRELNYSRFYSKCKNVFESILYKTTFNKHLANSIYNDAVLIFREEAKKEEKIENVKGFLYQIAINVYLNKIKPERKYTSRFSFVIDNKNAFLNISDITLGDSFDAEFERKVTWALNELKKEKPDQEKALRAFYLEELSYQEVVTNYGYSLKEVKSYVQNGKQNLKRIFEKMEMRNNN